MTAGTDSDLEPQTIRSAAALLIGDELLTGKITDQNLQPLAQTLRSLGIELGLVAIAPDRVSVIAEELNRLRATHDIVVTSGGVGPTHDDVTMEGVATAYATKVVPHPALEQLLAKVYGQRLQPTHLLMARVPEGARLFVSEDLSWPTVVMGQAWILPGIPELFRSKLPTLRRHLRGPFTFHTRSCASSLDEAQLKAALDDTVRQCPEVSVGSYPRWFDPRIKTRVTFDGASSQAVSQALELFCALLPAGEPFDIE